MIVTISDIVCTGLIKNTKGLNVSKQLKIFGIEGLWINDFEENCEIYYLNSKTFEIKDEDLISLSKLTKKVAIDIEISNGQIFIS